VGMPGRNGYEVARYIKQTPQLAHIPVLLLTGAFEPVDESAAAVSDGILAKPFEPPQVIARVKELLRQRDDQQAQPHARSSADLDDYFEQLDRAITERVETAAPPFRLKPEATDVGKSEASDVGRPEATHASGASFDKLRTSEQPPLSPGAPPTVVPPLA